MIKNISIIALLLIGLNSMAQTKWITDASHTSVRFTATHMKVAEVEGQFKKFDISVSSNGDDFQNAQITASLDVNSISTENEMRDKHLQGDDFFNAEKFPKITFKSTSFKKADDGSYILEGDLTIRDVTKKVSLKVKYNGIVKDPWGNTKAGFKLQGSINRFDYNLKYNAMAETINVVSDIVEFRVNVELQKP